MHIYNLDGDFDDQKESYLNICLGITVMLALVSFAIALGSNNAFIPIPTLLTGIVIISWTLCGRKLTTVAIWIYLIGLICGLASLLVFFKSNTALCVLLLIPVVLATVLLKRYQLIAIASLCIAAMYIITALQVGLLAAFGVVFAPVLLTILFVAVICSNVGSMLELVYWAKDIQQKDTHRAESFYRQKEQLTDALTQLSYANTQLETLNKKLTEAQHKADQANKAKSVFLSNMSHELRTPLNVLIGYSSTMLERPIMYGGIDLPTPYRADIQLIQENGYHLLSLINDILDLSKIEAGKLTLAHQATYLPNLFTSCIANVTGLVKDKPIQIRQDFPQDLPIVWADPMRVRQIILNLMSNAIKFTHVGSVILRAHMEDGWVRISVIDTGIGIPENALKHIFDRFEQAERDTEKHYGGTGLGLDISKQLAFMHGSDLTVKSRVGNGSTFSFTLPLYTNQAGQDGAVYLTPEHSTAQMLDTDNTEALLAVMLVEDNVVQHTLMHRTLESSGYIVINVHDGNEALGMAEALVPDLIILDILLPEVDGWAIYQGLRKNSETSMIPILVCTAVPKDEFPEDIAVEHCLSKPFSSDDFIARVQGLIGVSNAPYELKD
jgi:signal transduction histidine kinase